MEIQPFFSLDMREMLVLPAFVFSDSLIRVGGIKYYKDAPHLDRNARIARRWRDQWNEHLTWQARHKPEDLRWKDFLGQHFRERPLNLTGRQWQDGQRTPTGLGDPFKFHPTEGGTAWTSWTLSRES